MRYALALAFVLAAALPALADEVTLKNGDKLSGTVLSAAGGKLTLKTPHSGNVAIPFAEIAALKTDARVTVKLKDGRTVLGVLTTADGKLQVSQEGGAPIAVDFADVAAFNEPAPAWHGGVTFSYKATDGNSHVSTLLLAAEASKITDVDEILGRFLWRYGDAHGEINERNVYALGRYRYILSDKLFLYGSGELYSDTFRDIRLREVLSAGAGYLVQKSPAWDLSVEAGFAYTDVDFYVADDDKFPGARLFGQTRISLPYGIDLVDLLTIYPNFKDSPAWTAHNELTLTKALSASWNASAGIITDHNNDPADGFEKRDNTYFVGLGYKF